MVIIRPGMQPLLVFQANLSLSLLSSYDFSFYQLEHNVAIKVALLTSHAPWIVRQLRTCISASVHGGCRPLWGSSVRGVFALKNRLYVINAAMLLSMYSAAVHCSTFWSCLVIAMQL